MPQMHFKFNKNDEYYTPEYAVYPILKKIKPNSVIWCPFDTCESNFVRVFKNNGFEVVHGHIKTRQDFFKVGVPQCDYIISNPPYSLKTEVFTRLFEIGKPFAMLVNYQGIFDQKERFEMFSKNNFELMILYPRINYMSEALSKEKGVPFQSAYLCKGICENQIEFVNVQRR